LNHPIDGETEGLADGEILTDMEGLIETEILGDADGLKL
jgi:hypothetical protein